jgi:hypothetical protein
VPPRTAPRPANRISKDLKFLIARKTRDGA